LQFTALSSTNSLGTSSGFGQTNIVITTSPATVRVPVYAKGGVLQTVFARFTDLDCYLFDDIDLTVPDCPGGCSISNFNLVAAGPCDTTGTREIVTELDVQPPWPGAEIMVGSDQRPAVQGRMVFTNTIDVTSSTTLDASFPPFGGLIIPSGFTLTSIFDCNTASLTLPTNLLCNSCGLITDINFTPGPCNGTGAIEATLELIHQNTPSNAFFSINGSLFPVGPSPQTETIQFPVETGARSTFVEIELLQQIQPGLTDPTNFTRICGREDIVALPACPEPPFNLSIEQVLNVSACRPDGTAEVTLLLTATNTSPFDQIWLQAGLPRLPGQDPTPSFTTTITAPTGTNSVTATLDLPFGGTWNINAHIIRRSVTSPPLSRIDAVVPSCPPPPCNLLSLVATTGPCDMFATAELFFTVTGTSNLLGKTVSVSIDDFDNGMDRVINFTYTNTPSIVKTIIDANGQSITASVAEVFIAQGTPFTFPNCMVPLQNGMIPDCYVRPTIAPVIVDIEVEHATGFRDVEFTVEPNLRYLVERTRELDSTQFTWGVRDEILSTTNSTTMIYRDVDSTIGRGVNWEFYRVRAVPTPIAP